MFGWIHESFRQLITERYGRNVWLKILELAQFNEGDECYIRHYYDDSETMRLANSIATIIESNLDDVWEAYGGFLIHYTMQTGWDDLLRAMASTLDEFLDALDSLHYFIDHELYDQTLKGPSFRSEKLSEGSILLHYYSRRFGLYPIVKGVVCEVARVIFGVEILMKVVDRRQETFGEIIEDHVIFMIKVRDDFLNSSTSIISRQISELNVEGLKDLCGLSYSDFCSIFPFHICFNKSLRVEHVGDKITEYCPWIALERTHLTELLEPVHPMLPLSKNVISSFINSVFITKLKIKTKDGEVKTKDIKLKGQMIWIANKHYMLYQCSLNATTISGMCEQDLYIDTLQIYDCSRSLILLNEARLAQVSLNKMLEKSTYTTRQMTRELAIEKSKTDDLLCELMPHTVVDSLRNGRPVEAHEFSKVTVLFTDIVSFTTMCATCTPFDVIRLLSDLYVKFDRIIALQDVYKVETIGDAYVICGGAPKPGLDDAERVFDAAIGLMAESKSTINPVTGAPIKIRIGLHTGDVIAGVVGIKMPKYCLFGETVTIANKMESHSLAGRIHLSIAAKKAAQQTNQHFEFSDRGMIEIAGQGIMHCFFLDCNRSRTIWQIVGREENDGSGDGYDLLHQSPHVNSAKRWKVLGMTLKLIATGKDGRSNRSIINSNKTDTSTFDNSSKLMSVVSKFRATPSDIKDSKYCVIL